MDEERWQSVQVHCQALLRGKNERWKVDMPIALGRIDHRGAADYGQMWNTRFTSLLPSEAEKQMEIKETMNLFEKKQSSARGFSLVSPLPIW